MPRPPKPKPFASPACSAHAVDPAYMWARPKLDLEARLLHRDGLMLIVDKPAGIPVHAGPGGGDNLEAHSAQLQFGLRERPALAHRLDRDTSGCLVLGRHRKALSKLGRLFADGKVEKVYWAVVQGGPAEDAGRIEAALLKRTNRNGGWRMVVDPAGQAAITDWRVLGRAGDRAWMEFRPRTGRTHQIRVHAATLGCPLVGDPMYGGPEGALMLHARAVTVPIRANKDPVHVEAPPPPHMVEALRSLGWEPPSHQDTKP
jgi:RluA family pseudouridine synthase